MGPQQRGFREEIRQTKQVGVGPQQRGFQKEIRQTKQVGVRLSSIQVDNSKSCK
ncbi:hypothetical protein [Staphylococcus lugdunensis]|uniref:hypothetical protein n=1 Tax=Staphylococcus lugdunensis TaxID=28035 RepID=UPI001F4C7954|nr:hypothetical protein [Staphylococcus lugdunensis]MCH8672612.1 hypothetical protein [Staphylococcus lugdunensis]MCH8674835.1 hypothetical protein [Staphylococcus lugdunensis]MCI2751881.1 hypothetical protein [Staphylococcus lugdunensis]MCI2761911.1 hypothetical protein [Staphylococcus lugdunensis]MCI2805453.1 hypothetical protein [Staphylococcus lugdunensis]